MYEPIEKKCLNTSNENCRYPFYRDWERLPFRERLHLATLECNHLNTLYYLKDKNITVKIKIREDTENNYTDNKTILFDFHGKESFCINTVRHIGVLPLVYGVSFDD
jgi:hypothetical protein